MSKFVKQIKERIEQEGGADEAIELNLSQLSMVAIDKQSKAILEKAKNVEVLVINQNQFVSLQSLPNWKLKSLSAAQNKLTDASLSKLSKYPLLVELILTENSIKTLEGIVPIFSLKSLEILDLSENPVSEIEGYREHIWEKMPFLKVLDYLDREGNEVKQQFDEDDEDNDGEVISDDQSSEDEDDDQDEDGSQEQQKDNNNNK